MARMRPVKPGNSSPLRPSRAKLKWNYTTGMRNHLRGAATLALLLCLASLASDDGLESSIKSVTQAYALVEDNAAEPVSAEQAFFQGAIPGMLRRLDPHRSEEHTSELQSL